MPRTGEVKTAERKVQDSIPAASVFLKLLRLHEVIILRFDLEYQLKGGRWIYIRQEKKQIEWNRIE